MKHVIVSLFMLFSLHVMKGQHFIETIPFDSTLINGSHINSINCTQAMSTDIQLDTSLYQYVNGIRFIIIIDSVNFGGPMSLSPVHPGDTIVLNSSTPAFIVPSSFNGNFWFRIKLIGTPNTPNQNYPCSIEAIQCACYCTNILIRKSTTNTSVCHVDLFNKINELEKQLIFNVYPNPVTTKLTFENSVEKTTIQLFDGLGNLIIETVINSKFEYDTSNLPNGMYLLFMMNESKGFTSQKILVQNNK